MSTQRQEITLAAVDCEHQIDADCIRLWRDPAKEGSALSQLVDRVVAAIEQSAPETTRQAQAVRKLATVLGFSELFVENDRLGIATMLNAAVRITRLEAEAAAQQSQEPKAEDAERPRVIAHEAIHIEGGGTVVREVLVSDAIRAAIAAERKA